MLLLGARGCVAGLGRAGGAARPGPERRGEALCERVSDASPARRFVYSSTDAMRCNALRCDERG